MINNHKEPDDSVVRAKIPATHEQADMVRRAVELYFHSPRAGFYPKETLMAFIGTYHDGMFRWTSADCRLAMEAWHNLQRWAPRNQRAAYEKFMDECFKIPLDNYGIWERASPYRRAHAFLGLQEAFEKLIGSFRKKSPLPGIEVPEGSLLDIPESKKSETSENLSPEVHCPCGEHVSRKEIRSLIRVLKAELRRKEERWPALGTLFEESMTKAKKEMS